MESNILINVINIFGKYISQYNKDNNAALFLSNLTDLSKSSSINYVIT